MFQYMFIKSRLSAKVMDIEGESREPGTYVIMYDKKDHSMENTNQLFYYDHNTHTIRSALTDLCFGINGDNELVMQHYSSSAGHQEWELDGDKIRNRNDGMVLDISGEDDGNGAKMCKFGEHGGLNQQWDFEYIQGHPPAHLQGQYGQQQNPYQQNPYQHHSGAPPRTPSPVHPHSSSSSSSSDEEEEKQEESEPQYFYIKSSMHNKVMDVEGADADTGAHVIMYDHNEGQTANQLWYFTGNNFIRSKLNGFALDCCDGDIKLYPFNEHSPTQGFRLEGDHIVSMHDNRCIDIAGEDQDNGAKLCAWERHENPNQRWYTTNV